MMRKREIWIQVSCYFLLLFVFSFIGERIEQGSFSIRQGFETMIRALSFDRFYCPLLLVPAILLVAYNSIAGAVWLVSRLYRHRTTFSFRSIAFSPLGLVIIVFALTIGLLFGLNRINDSQTQKLIHSFFQSDLEGLHREYRVDLITPLDHSVFSKDVVELRIDGGAPLIRLADGRILIAVINKGQRRIVFSEN